MLAAFAAALLQGAAATAHGPLTVRVTGVSDDRGQVRVDVCGPSTFLRGGCEFSVAAPAVKGETLVLLPDVPPGRWAIQAYHDRNADREVDRGPLGIPREAVGFSRAPPIGLRGPSFTRAAFEHDGPETVSVRLRRFF